MDPEPSSSRCDAGLLLKELKAKLPGSVYVAKHVFFFFFFFFMLVTDFPDPEQQPRMCVGTLVQKAAQEPRRFLLLEGVPGATGPFWLLHIVTGLLLTELRVQLPCPCPKQGSLV